MNCIRAAFFVLFFTAGAAADEIKVSAAVSLKEALTEIAQDYKKAGGDEVGFTFGSSGQLATQITNGAPADAFISAANKQVDDLIKHDLAVSSSRRVIVGNALVLIVPAVAKDPPRSFADLADARFKRIAIGDPKSVPAGEYAMQTLSNLKLAASVADRLIYGTDVRQVLTYVEGGEVAGGLVYATDARVSGDKVRIMATAAEDTHGSIVYPAVVIKASKQQGAALKFLDFLNAAPSRKIFTDKGFSLPTATAAVTAESVAP